MPLIIDAYNVLHLSHLLPQRYAMISATQLAAMLDRLDFARGIAVVCDGDPKPSEDQLLDTGQVRVLYSGKQRDADSIIEELIDDESAPRQLTVVSNDRRIQKAAKRRRATALSSEAFLRQLSDRLRDAGSEQTPEKPESAGDVAEWLQKFGIDEQNSPKPSDPGSETERWMREFGFEDED